MVRYFFCRAFCFEFQKSPYTQNKAANKHLYRRNNYNSVNFKFLTGFQTILPCSQQVDLTWARDSIGKLALGQRSTSQKHVTSMSCKLEPAIWSCDTGQRIPCFDRCQLIIAWMSNIKEVHGKPRLFVSLEYGRHVGQLRRRRRRAYAPTSNTASHDDHEKINSWVSFSFRMMPMGLRLAALRAAGAPLSVIVI